MAHAINTDKTLVAFDNKSTGETVDVQGEIVNREKRHDAEWCNEIVALEVEDDSPFEFVMGDTYKTRRVKRNGNLIGHWTAFIK